jgi:hypothetical protein
MQDVKNESLVLGMNKRGIGMILTSLRSLDPNELKFILACWV